LTRATGNEGYNGRIAKIQPLTTPNSLGTAASCFNGSWHGSVSFSIKETSINGSWKGGILYLIRLSQLANVTLEWLNPTVE
jgi:hypothetical protein